jgi:hypothetical protein
MDVSTLIWPAGAAAFGMFVGFVIRFFLERFEEYTVTSLSAVLGTPIAGTLLAFLAPFGPYRMPAYTMGLVFGLVLYQFLFQKFPSLPMRRHGSSPFVVLESLNRIVILDKAGDRATWERRQKIYFRREANEVLITKLSMDGDLAGQPVLTATPLIASLDARPSAGITSFYARFSAPASKGETVDITLKIPLDKCFTGQFESIGHEILQETQRLLFEVEFPAGRRCRTGQLVRVLGADVQKNGDITIAGDTITAEVHGKMKIAERYRLEWTW